APRLVAEPGGDGCTSRAGLARGEGTLRGTSTVRADRAHATGNRKPRRPLTSLSGQKTCIEDRGLRLRGAVVASECGEGPPLSRLLFFLSAPLPGRQGGAGIGPCGSAPSASQYAWFGCSMGHFRG